MGSFGVRPHEIDIFVSPIGVFNVITLEHIKNKVIVGSVALGHGQVGRIGKHEDRENHDSWGCTSNCHSLWMVSICSSWLFQQPVSASQSMIDRQCTSNFVSFVSFGTRVLCHLVCSSRSLPEVLATSAQLILHFRRCWETRLFIAPGADMVLLEFLLTRSISFLCENLLPLIRMWVFVRR